MWRVCSSLGLVGLVAFACGEARPSQHGPGSQPADADVGLTQPHDAGADASGADSPSDLDASAGEDASVRGDAALELDAGDVRPEDLQPLLSDAGADNLFEAETEARELYATTPIRLIGRVNTLSGGHVAGAEVRLGDLRTVTDAEGDFVFTGLQRRNRSLEIRAPGFKTELLYVHLARPTSQVQAALDPIELVPDDDDLVRFLFGGDTAFGRRFVDPREQTPPLEIPPTDPDALIDSRDPAPGTRAAMQHVAPWFRNAEYPIVNLETPVTATPDEYHDNKSYIFFTLPESLEVFPWLGVRYVGLGNNHVYDYLEDGISDTLANLAAYGLASSGAGITVAQAFAPYHESIKGHPYSFLAMTSVTGVESPPLYVATVDPETGSEKGGAADLTDTERVRSSIEQERLANRLPIVQLHTGAEYTYFPTPYARERMSLAVQSGAALVVAHHPHVAQGFSFEDGVLIVEGLGNLCFDQARQETMLGLLAQVDLRGEELALARALPVYLEDYTPRPIAGELATLLLRRVAEVSDNANVAIENDTGRVVTLEQAAEIGRRERVLQVELGEGGQHIVDLRGLFTAGESVVLAQLDAKDVQLQAGEDLLLYGDFEDWDVDAEHFELARWDITGAASFPCLHKPYRGAAALCTTRRTENESNAVVAFRNRVRVLGEALDMPNKDLSFVGYARGDNAGPLRIEMRYYASEGEAQFGEENVWEHRGGHFRWRYFFQDIHMPPDLPGQDPLTASAHALRFFIHQGPPGSGSGAASFDDLAVVSWRPALGPELTLRAPNPIQFLKVSGPPGNYALTVQVARMSAGG